MARRRRKKKKRRGTPASTRIALYVALSVVALLLWRRLDSSSKQSRLTSEIEALARVIRSEIGIGTAKQQLHVAWAVRNLALERGQTIAEMACLPCGPQGPARPVSSVQEATPAARELAVRVLLAAASADPTGGASHFINPRLQRKLSRGKRSRHRHRSYQRVRRRWIQRYGWEPYYRLGPSLEMWGVKRKKVSFWPSPR